MKVRKIKGEKMKKRKIKKSVIKKGIVLLVVIIIIIVLIKIVNTIKYHKTDEYKLLKIGYNKGEITEILKQKDTITYALNHEYNESIDDFIKEKYYINKNLERYVNYKENHSDKTFREIVSIVNVNADNKWYTNTKKTDTTKKELMLVNKFNYLEKDYKIENVKEISSRYAYSENNSNDEIMEHYKKMFKAAEDDGIKLIISSAYRTYKEQEETYDYYKNTKGEELGNKYAAKPGHSEHQTGLAFDILTLNATTENFEKTKEFEWLKDNSYKYGFIMRYPKDKEYLTGYEYEPWHYRYVGIDAAKQIKNENITFDEYYAYYINQGE